MVLYSELANVVFNSNLNPFPVTKIIHSHQPRRNLKVDFFLYNTTNPLVLITLTIRLYNQQVRCTIKNANKEV